MLNRTLKVQNNSANSKFYAENTGIKPIFPIKPAKISETTASGRIKSYKKSRPVGKLFKSLFIIGNENMTQIA